MFVCRERTKDYSFNCRLSLHGRVYRKAFGVKNQLFSTLPGNKHAHTHSCRTHLHNSIATDVRSFPSRADDTCLANGCTLHRTSH